MSTEAKSEDKGLVCVTGASGYIASHLVQQLLDAGYHVRGTVRSTSNPDKTNHLTSLDGAADRLELFEADMTVPGAFAKAIEGCVGVFHTASPLGTNDGEAMIDIAVNGTKEAMNAVKAAGTVKRIVLTASMASIAFNGHLPKTHVYTSADWSDVENMTQRKTWYPLSKTKAEQYAWKFVEENPAFELVTIHPTLVFGPPLQPAKNLSLNVYRTLFDGSRSEIPQSTLGYVDVRDVAKAHILAYEKSEAAGNRYIVMEGSYPMKHFIEEFRKVYPEGKYPSTEAAGDPPTPMQVDSAPIQALGLKYTPLSESTVDTFAVWKARGSL